MPILRKLKELRAMKMTYMYKGNELMIHIEQQLKH